jgi:hypothetical protein
MNYIISYEGLLRFAQANGWCLVRKSDTGKFLFVVPNGTVVGGICRDDDLVPMIYNETYNGD